MIDVVNCGGEYGGERLQGSKDRLRKAGGTHKFSAQSSNSSFQQTAHFQVGRLEKHVGRLRDIRGMEVVMVRDIPEVVVLQDEEEVDQVLIIDPESADDVSLLKADGHG